MPKSLAYSLKFILLVAVQVLVLNNIQFSGYVNPYLYILFILTFPLGVPRIATLFVALLLGLSVDIFSNSLGTHAFSCVLIAYLRPYLLKVFTNIDTHKADVPDVRAVGRSAFFRYAAVMTVIHHIALFGIDTFSLHDPVFLVLRIVYSSIFTLLLIFGIEYFRAK